jgi:hypothetical protein
MRWSRFVFAPLLLALLAGCGSRGADPLAPDSGGSAEQAAVEQEIALHPDLVDDSGISTSDASVDADLLATASLGPAANGRPLWFWRRIRDVERRFEIAFADTDSTGRPATAHVRVHVWLRGAFVVAVGDSGRIDSLVHKPLEDHALRNLLLKRVRLPGARHDVWKIVATSGVEVTSRNAQTRIESVRIQAAGLDTTITDPLALFRLRSILRLLPAADVNLTVTTGRADDIVLLYAGLHRFRFHNHGDGTHTGTWRTSVFEGFRHFGVNALSRGTLFDPAAPYDSKAWILPYRVSAADPGEYAL